MQKTFKAVRNGDWETVRQILEANPEEIHAVAKQPPKKDDGQSLLQVALKTGNLDIANLLLDFHADVNFMESEECCNEWRIPVLHDAIRCAVMNSRWTARDYVTKTYEVQSSKEASDKAYAVLKRILEMGADISSKDSYGNTSLERAVADARQILPTYNYATKTINDNRIITEDLRFDLTRIFNVLFEFGANNQWTDRISGNSIKDHYSEEPVAEFLETRILPEKKQSVFRRLFKK